jgi:hypothetical protein
MAVKLDSPETTLYLIDDFFRTFKKLYNAVVADEIRSKVTQLMGIFSRVQV